MSVPVLSVQMNVVEPSVSTASRCLTRACFWPTRAVVGRHLLEVNPCFDRLACDRGFYRDELIAEIAQRGGVRGCPQLSAAVRAAFPTAAEIAPEWHLRMQAAVQRHVDAAVSKTVNLPATVTVYRYGSREGQVLSYAAPDAVLAQAGTAYSGGCGGRSCEF